MFGRSGNNFSKAVLCLRTAFSVSVVRSVNRPDSDVPEVSYEPIIIDIPDGPIPAGETWDNEASAADIAENDIPTADSFKVHLSDGSSKLWITVGVVSGAGVIFTAMCQKGNENR